MIFLRLRRDRKRSFAGACAFAVGIAGSSGICDALELADVLSPLASVERSDATFEETRHIAALTAPVVRRGSLHYARPATLEMIVETPIRERVRVSGKSLKIEGPNGTRDIRLAEAPIVAAWIESVRATLAGDANALGRYFIVRTSGDSSRWMLTMTPLDAELSSVVSSVTISGAGPQITQIEVDESSGDRSITVVAPIARKQ
jgi:hypothetical protein